MNNGVSKVQGLGQMGVMRNLQSCTMNAASIPAPELLSKRFLTLIKQGFEMTLSFGLYQMCHFDDSPRRKTAPKKARLFIRLGEAEKSLLKSSTPLSEEPFIHTVIFMNILINEIPAIDFSRDFSPDESGFEMTNLVSFLFRVQAPSLRPLRNDSGLEISRQTFIHQLSTFYFLLSTHYVRYSWNNR
jgi:hypothetical protein